MRARYLIAAIACTTATAAADPLAQLDLDGDHLVLAPTGALAITGHGAPQTLALGGPITHATIVRATAATTPTAIATVTVGDHDEAIVIAKAAGAWREVTRTTVGGVGLDADYGNALAVLPIGIVRYQTRDGIARCDGQPTLLFPEGWRDSDKKFVPIRPPDEVSPTATALIAHPDAAAAATPVLFQARAASSEPDAADAGALGIPHELDDGKLDTAWHASDGRGQFFTFEPRVAGAKAAEVRFVPGPGTAPDAANAARPQRLAIVTAHDAWWVDVPQTAGDTAYLVTLPAPVEGCVTIVVGGDRRQPSGIALAELEVFAAGERSGGGDAALAQAVATGAPGATNAAAALAHRGAAGVAAIDAALPHADDAGRRELLRALIASDAPEATEVLVRAITDNWLRGVDLLAAIATLGRLGDAAPLHVLASRPGLDVEVRVAAAAAIRPTDEPATDLLASLAGSGPRALRHQVIESLAPAKLAWLEVAASAAATPAAAGDLDRAIAKHAHAVADDRPAALAFLLAALPAATDYERRYRLIDAIATLGDANALETLEQLLRMLARDPEGDALRQVAARALATRPHDEAVPLLLALARDPNPGVRLDALAGLADATTEPAGPWHAEGGPDGIDRALIAALATDAWPEVRTLAAGSLGSRCQRQGPATALGDALAKDAAMKVRLAALDALATCNATGIGARLAALWNDKAQPLELRAHAVDVAVIAADPALGPQLIAKLATWRGAALENADALELAQHAAVAIGRLHPAGAVDALLDALADSAYPEIVASAASALGAMGPLCPPKAQAQLAQLAGSDERQVALAARHAAAVCGK